MPWDLSSKEKKPEPFSTSQCVRGVSLYCLKPISQVSTILFHNICQAWILLFFGIPYSSHFNSFNNGSIVVYSDWVSLIYNISTTFNHNRHSTMIAKVVLFQQCSECKKKYYWQCSHGGKTGNLGLTLVQPNLVRTIAPPPQIKMATSSQLITNAMPTGKKLNLGLVYHCIIYSFNLDGHILSAHGLHLFNRLNWITLITALFTSSRAMELNTYLGNAALDHPNAQSLLHSLIHSLKRLYLGSIYECIIYLFTRLH